MAFAVTETVWNGGTSAGGGGTQTISLVPAGGGAAIALATRSIPSLAPGAHSTVTTTVTIPVTIAAGSYQLGAGAAGCASSCLKSTGMVTVTAGQQSHVLSLALNASGPGLGAINVNNAASGALITSCQGVCSTPIAAGTTITVSYAGPLSANFQGWFLLGATTAMKPPSGAFGGSQMSTFVGWQGQGCTGQVQGNQLRVVTGASITCVAKFQ